MDEAFNEYTFYDDKNRKIAVYYKEKLVGIELVRD